MLAAERLAVIEAALERDGVVRSAELAARLGVSEMTVRRDLRTIADSGRARTVRGGAVVAAAAHDVTEEPGFLAKSQLNREAKEALAERAAGLVRPGSAVALSAGTTTLALARHLQHVDHLTVVTNSVHVADLLHDPGRPDRTVLLTGGMRTPSDALVGPIAVATLRELQVDLCVLGVHGIDADAGLTTPNLLEAETDQAMMRCASQVAVVADSSKWGTRGLARIAPLSDVDILVTGPLDTEAAARADELVGRLDQVEGAA